jgi:hypothetical protein
MEKMQNAKKSNPQYARTFAVRCPLLEAEEVMAKRFDFMAGV